MSAGAYARSTFANAPRCRGIDVPGARFTRSGWADWASWRQTAARPMRRVMTAVSPVSVGERLENGVRDANQLLAAHVRSAADHETRAETISGRGPVDKTEFGERPEVSVDRRRRGIEEARSAHRRGSRLGPRSSGARGVRARTRCPRLLLRVVDRAQCSWDAAVLPRVENVGRAYAGRRMRAIPSAPMDATRHEQRSTGECVPARVRPVRLRNRTLTSRITFGAHTANMAEGGLPGERHVGYYRERALGGAGMIVVEPVPIHRTGVLTRGNFLHDDDAIVPAFRRVTDACRAVNPRHRDDPAALPRGSARRRRQLVRAELVAVGSAVVARRRRQPRDDGRRDRGPDRGIRRGAAARAQASGFDGIEVFAAYHAVVDAFWRSVVEPANRRVGRLVREPDAILGRDPAADPRAVRRRLHRRTCSQRRPGVAGDADGRGAGGDRRLARRAPADGLRHVRDGLVLRLLPDHPAVALRAAAWRAVRRRAQGASSATRLCRPRATSGRPPPPKRCSRPGMPTS